jgi:hypothetical protein
MIATLLLIYEHFTIRTSLPLFVIVFIVLLAISFMALHHALSTVLSMACVTLRRVKLYVYLT